MSLFKGTYTPMRVSKWIYTLIRAYIHFGYPHWGVYSFGYPHWFVYSFWTPLLGYILISRLTLHCYIQMNIYPNEATQNEYTPQWGYPKLIYTQMRVSKLIYTLIRVSKMYTAEQLLEIIYKDLDESVWIIDTFDIQCLYFLTICFFFGGGASIRVWLDILC